MKCVVGILALVALCSAIPHHLPDVPARGDDPPPPPPPVPVGNCSETSPVTCAGLGFDCSTIKCGDSARSFYTTFIDGSDRICATSGVPYHDHQAKNPNEACETWSYMRIPAVPVKGDTFQLSEMGPVGMSTTGAFLYNHLSNPSGKDNVAVIIEGESFDDCHGHADPDKQYHYHKIPKCIPGWDTCGFMGYLEDGFSVYGLGCVGKEAQTLRSCYTLQDGKDADDTSSYSYADSADCDLDEANGYDFGGDKGYAYVFTENYPWIMPGIFGKTNAKVCRFY